MKAGPTAPHALSLWNFSLSPGWTADEVHRLRLCLMAHGVGRWSQIVQSGHLVGKTISQLNLQTQKLLGQQSLAEFTGLQIDPADVFLVNRERIKAGAKTKMGLVINEGPNPSREAVVARLRENRTRFALPETRVREAEAELRHLAREQQWRDAQVLFRSLPMTLQQKLNHALSEGWRHICASDDRFASRTWIQVMDSGGFALPAFAERRSMSAEELVHFREQLERLLQVLRQTHQKITQEKENWQHSDELVSKDGTLALQAPCEKGTTRPCSKRTRGAEHS
ncbi:hypothetical protein CCYA_CCYA03G0851 [Cyanidiococcus yangmingshanensis]|nr:hypothetical protein CCYA_CCYA03G0851 [Cyanidiococcus yangmingshanensis]